MGSTGGNCMSWKDDQEWDCKSNGKMRFLLVADEYSRKFMRIPQKFGSYLRKIISADTINLNAPSGCTYAIEVCREMGDIVLRSGWDLFANAHNLEEDDSLVFKFCGSSSFKVQIYSSCDGSEKITSCINPDPPSTTSDHHIPNGNEIPHPGHVQTPAGVEYFTSGGSHLTKAQDKKVLEMARTIKSEIPLYVATMSKSNVDFNGCSIKIPSILMKDVKEEVFKANVKLEAPNASVYGVSATQQGNDEIVLQSGWDTFVIAHHVQERDLIIFRHKGNSRLEVFILDPSGHQKTSPLFGIGDVSNTQEMCDDSVEMVDPPHETVGSSDDENNVAAYSAKSARRQEPQLGHCVKSRRMASTSCPSTKSEHEIHEDLQGSMVGRVDQCPLNSNSEGTTGPPYITSNKVTLSRAQEEIVLKKVQAIQSQFPIYVAVLNRSGTGNREYGPKLVFTLEYSRRCLPSATQDLTLELEGCRGKQWHTSLQVQHDGDVVRSVKISSGWYRFVRDNCLVLGDICLFELVEATRDAQDERASHSQGRSTYVELYLEQSERAGAEWTPCGSSFVMRGRSICELHR